MVHALRTLLRNGALTVTAILTLGLTLAANTALFSLVNAILLRPLPGIDDPGRLVNVHRTTADGTTFQSFSNPPLGRTARAAHGTRGTRAPIVGARISWVDPDQPLANVRTMDAVVAASVSERRFSMLLLSAFAGMSLLLAVLGLYGVASHAVSRRTQEVGVRMAFGARPDHLLALAIGEGLKLAMAGVVLGGAAAFALARAITGSPYGVTPRDPLTFAAMAAALMIAALVAVALPARRAARLDPMAALREE